MRLNFFVKHARLSCWCMIGQLDNWLMLHWLISRGSHITQFYHLLKSATFSNLPRHLTRSFPINLTWKNQQLSPTLSDSFVEMANNKKERIGRPILACLIAALGPVCFGYCLGYSSAALVDLKSAKANSAIRLSDSQGSWFSVSIFCWWCFSTTHFFFFLQS